MTITQIRYFVQVAENMNFTKAARQLYVAQQVVSKQVKRLEEELGFLLFERTAQGITLSAGGKKMYQYWKKMLIEQQVQISLAKSKMQETEKECNGLAIHCKRLRCRGYMHKENRFPPR